MSNGNDAAKTRRWTGCWVLLLLVLFFLPVDLGARGRIHEQLENMLHVPVFFALTSCFVAWMPRRGWKIRAGGALAVALLCGLLVELFQPRFGRTAEGVDVGMGLIGSLLGIIWVWGWQEGGGRKAWAIAAVVLVLAMMPLLRVLMDQYEAKQSFPLLASFESSAEMGRWDFHGIDVRRCGEQVQDGRFSLRMVVTEPEAYPGLFLTDMPKDWGSLKRICLDVAGTEGCRVWVRLDDLPGNPPYAERFQTFYVLTSGVQTICLDAATICTDRGRRLDLRHVYAFGLFFDGVRQGDVMYCDGLRGVQ